MVSTEFIAKWHGTPLTEQAGAQTYFNDLCDMLGVDKPNDPETYCFERGAARTGASHGWADVWKRGFFAWENKRPAKNLAVALKQLNIGMQAVRHVRSLRQYFSTTDSAR